MTALEIKDLTVSYAGRVALEDVSLVIEERELVIVFGPNGAGKTTLLKVMSGELKPDGGSIRLFGASVEENRRLIGYVSQSSFAGKEFPVTVEKVVLMGRYGLIGMFKRPAAADYAAAHAALEEVGLGDMRDVCFNDLSGGQRQRTFIARALAGEPRLLLLDEATSGVDAGNRESLLDLITRIKSRMTVMFVTHDVSVITPAVDKIVCLNKRLVSHGRPAEALTDEAISCMYGRDVAVFSHCHTPHVHVKDHNH